MFGIVIKRHANGPRLFIAGQRVHHGASCSILALASLAAKQRRVAAIFLILAAHDHHDWKVWFVRESLKQKGHIS